MCTHNRPYSQRPISFGIVSHTVPDNNVQSKLVSITITTAF